MVHQIMEIIKVLLLISTLFLTNVLHAQKKIYDLNDVSFAINEYYLVTLVDNTSIFGVFRERNDDQIFFQTNYYSTLIANVNDIKYVRKVSEDNVYNGKYIPPNNHFNKYFFGQTAFIIPKYSLNLSTYSFFTSVEYGISDHVSIAGGLTLLSALNLEAFSQFRAISPKIGGFKISENVTAGAHSFYAIFDDQTHRMASSIWTLGNRNENLTFGLGYFSISKDINTRVPMTNMTVSERKTFTSGLITLSGMIRLSRRTTLMTENWLRKSSELPSFYSLGFRMAGAKFMFDFMFYYEDDRSRDFYPIIGFSYKF